MIMIVVVMMVNWPFIRTLHITCKFTNANFKKMCVCCNYLSSLYNDRSEESSGVIGVTFSGPNVKAISVILNEQVRTRSEAKTAIARLKEANLPVRPKFSLGFMFACAGRGLHFYEEDNVESEEFHKLFPDTPLFGFFGGGEIGCYNLTAGRDIEGLLLSNTAHAYTTIMCLLTFDPS